MLTPDDDDDIFVSIVVCSNIKYHIEINKPHPSLAGQKTANCCPLTQTGEF